MSVAADARRVAAQAIRASRGIRGWTLDELSAAMRAHGADVHPDSLSRLETNRRRLDVGELVAIAAALDVSPCDLLTGHVVIPRGLQ